MHILFFLNHPSTPEIYTLSLHDALPILTLSRPHPQRPYELPGTMLGEHQLAQHRAWEQAGLDRKSTRLNSSHVESSYAVFCLKKKNSARSSSLRDSRCMLQA